MRHTQDSCAERWKEARRQFVAAIDQINADTPAVPITEPRWWVEMMESRRAVTDMEKGENDER